MIPNRFHASASDGLVVIAVVSEVNALLAVWKNRGLVIVAFPLPFAAVFAEFRPERKAFVVNVAWLRNPFVLSVAVNSGVCRSAAGRKVTLVKNIDIVVVVGGERRGV